jgi:hypothetical protein
LALSGAFKLERCFVYPKTGGINYGLYYRRDVIYQVDSLVICLFGQKGYRNQAKARRLFNANVAPGSF